MTRHRVLVCVTALVSAGTVLACGSKPTPTQPTPTPPPTTVSITSIQVGVAGNAPTVLAPGQKLQLFAQAISSDGTTSDVTNLATWQSSSPVVATVSVGGLLTAAVEGNLDVSATYQNRTGSIHADVRKPGCEATLSPPSLTYGPFGGGASVQVATTLSDCRWTAKSDAAWLPFNYDPGRSGTGSFGYSVPGNSTPEERTANIVISIAGGPTVVHKISQEKPVGCSYVVSPARITLPSTGGNGVFDVATTPGDCQWMVRNNGSSGSVPITLTSPASGRGAGQISYKTASNPFTFDLTYTIEIAGLSGLNPAGVHTVTISKR